MTLLPSIRKALIAKTTTILKNGGGLSLISSREFSDVMHERIIKMPSIMSAKTGNIDVWHKKEGDTFQSADSLCEVTLSDEGVTVAVVAHRSGVIASIIVEAGQTATVNEPIAMFVDNMSEYMEHVENIRLASGEAEMMKEMKPPNDDPLTALNSKTLLRQIKTMMKSGDINPDSEFAKELQMLARKGNSDLLSVFEASCEFEYFSAESFDKNFFLHNAEEVVKESLELKNSSH